MSEHERTERDHGERAVSRFQRRVIEGITGAHTEQREIDPGTARLIAHVLGRAVGRDSHLADYGRIGTGDYEQLRSEYLDLYEDPHTPPMIREWIDWFGTFLTANHLNATPPERSPDARAAPEPAFARGEVSIGDRVLTVHVPASITGPALQALVARLEALPELEDDAFIAFLSIRDVDASDPDIATIFHDSHVGSYENVVEALRVLTPLDDWEAELADWARGQGLAADAVTLNIASIEATARTAYDLIRRNDRIHAFTK
jgi:hypothetical protein